MPLFASVIASIGLILSGWLYTHPVEQTPALGASQTISSLTAGTSLDDADTMAYVDNSGTPTTKKITWGNATSTLQSWFTTLYSPIFSTSAGLAGLLSDETGSAGGFVRATGPSIGTPTLTAPTLDVAGTDATGDLYYNGGSGLLTRLPIGANQKYLMASTTGLAEWSSDYILSNPQTSSSTFTATTTIEASSLTNKALVLNGLAYKWPSSRGASSTVLTEDGSGNLNFQYPMQLIDIGSFATQTIQTGHTVVSHGLNATPNLIKIFATCVTADAVNIVSAFSDGTYRVAGAEAHTIAVSGAVSGGIVNEIDNTNIVHLEENGGGSEFLASVLAVSDTTFTLNTTTGNTATCDGDSARLKWEVYR